MENVKHFKCIVFLLLVFYNLVFGIGEPVEGCANTGFQFLEEPVSSGKIGMGSVGAAVRGSGFSFYNPALPFLMGKAYISAEYGQYPRADLKRSNFEVGFSIREWFFGLSCHSESISDIFSVNDFGNLPNYGAPFSAQFTDLSLDIGYSRWEQLAFAVCLNVMQDRIEREYAYAFSISGGAIYIPVPDRFYIGLSITNIKLSSTPMLGSDKKEDWGEGERLPLNSRLGAVWTDSFKNDMQYTIAADIVYRSARDRDLPFRRYIQERFTFPVGFEFKPLSLLCLRIGKRFNHPTEVFNFGIGMNLEDLSVDASFLIPKLIDDSEFKWLIGITYCLKSQNTKKT